MKISISSILSYCRLALLGLVTPNLRAVIVDYKEDKNLIGLHLYYHNPPTEKDIELSELIDVEFFASLPILVEEEIKLITLPYPNPIPQGWLVSKRYED